MYIAYLINDKFPYHMYIFVYIFRRLLDFNMKLNSTILLEFINTQSDNEYIAELFKYGLFSKLSVDFDLKEISAKCGLLTVTWFRAYTLFFKSDFIYSMTIFNSFILCYVFFSNNFFNSVLKLNHNKENSGYVRIPYCNLSSPETKSFDHQ